MRCWICSSYSVLDDSEWLCHIIYFVGWAETFVPRNNKFNPVSVCEKNMCSSLKQTFWQIGSKPCFPDTALQRLWSGKILKWVPLPCACLCEKPWKTWQCGPWSGMQISTYSFGGFNHQHTISKSWFDNQIMWFNHQTLGAEDVFIIMKGLRPVWTKLNRAWPRFKSIISIVVLSFHGSWGTKNQGDGGISFFRWSWSCWLQETVEGQQWRTWAQHIWNWVSNGSSFDKV